MILPIKNIKYIPINQHPGAFGFKRKHDIHTGVDLYCSENDIVYAIEDSKIINKGIFTGEKVGTNWWNETYFLMLEGKTGVFCYGEILIKDNLNDDIKEGQEIGKVIPVLKESKIRKDIEGHSNNMLHLELYKHGTKQPVSWQHNKEKPYSLLDPSSFLLSL